MNAWKGPRLERECFQSRGHQRKACPRATGGDGETRILVGDSPESDQAMIENQGTSVMAEATTAPKVKTSKPAAGSFEMPKFEMPKFEIPKVEMPAAFREFAE